MVTVVPWTLKTVIRQMLPPTKESKQRPEAFVSHANSKYYVLSQYDSALVTKADGSGAAWYRRDPRKLRRLLARSASARSALTLNWERLRKEYARRCRRSPLGPGKTFGITEQQQAEPQQVPAER